MATMPYFVSELPATEIRDDGHVVVGVGEVELIATVHIYRTFLEREWVKLNEWDLRHRATDVVPLCELCRRHDLPRHTED